MKGKKPVLALAVSLIMAALVIVGVLVIGKQFVKENKLVKANDQVKTFLANETEFDTIVEYVEADPERRRFLGITLVELSKNEEKYVINFEERYPRYKAYRNMVGELARQDYSEWVGSVISGETETEFESNVFEYLSTLNDDRYLDEAIRRFGKTLETTGDSGFAFRFNKDAFITGALGIYIAQFPASNTQFAKTVIGQRIGAFIDLSKDLTAEIAGIPLNKLYLYLYIKYFGLQDFIDRKMDSFMAQGSERWDGKSWSMNLVNNLIKDLTTMGKGISQNYYSMFRMGLDKNDAVYVYIALQVLEDIGFDDPVLHNWLNRNYRHFEGRLSITTTTTSGYSGLLDFPESRTRTTPIVIANEIQQVRNAIKGKSDVPFEETLKEAVSTSAKRENLIIPRVSAEEEALREIENNSEQYTQDKVSRALVTWKLKHHLLLVVAAICLFAALICSLVTFARPLSYHDEPDNFIAWIILPITGLVLFFGFWNRYDNLSGFQIMPLFAFLVFGGIMLVIVMKNRLLRVPGRALWERLLIGCGSFNYNIKRYGASQFYYDTANVSLENRVGELIKKNDVSGTMELLQNSADNDPVMRIIKSNPAFFGSIDSSEMEKLFKDRLFWIDWLKTTNRNDVLEKIRLSTNTIINGEIPMDLLMDDRQYSEFLAGFAAFDHADPNNRGAIQNIVSNTLVKRYNTGNRTITGTAVRIIDRMDLLINPSVLMALAQEENARETTWLWKKMENDAVRCDAPDDWFATLIIPLDPDRFQKTIIIHSLLKMVNAGFSRCKKNLPALVLLIQAKMYLDTHNNSYSGSEYNRILEQHKSKIEKAQKQAQTQNQKPAGKGQKNPKPGKK